MSLYDFLVDFFIIVQLKRISQTETQRESKMLKSWPLSVQSIFSFPSLWFSQWFYKVDWDCWKLFSVTINGILLPKLFWPTVRKNCSSDWEKILIFEAEGREFAKKFEITRTIYSNSERSEQFLLTECFFNLFLEVSHFY